MHASDWDELAASVTPEKVRKVALAIWSRRRHKELSAVQLYHVVKALTAGAQPSGSAQCWQAWARLREAVIAAVRQADDLTYVAAT